MRKNDLIKMLQEIEGNPEIMLWNGIVEDVMPIKPKLNKQLLTKIKFPSYLKFVESQQKQYNTTYTLSEKEILRLKNQWKQHHQYQYENPAYGTNVEMIGAEHLSKKTVLILQPKTTGRKSKDRYQSIEY